VSAPLTVIIERNGMPLELIGERDLRRAVERGWIARDTPVTAVRTADGPALLRAEELPELRALLGEPEPEPEPAAAPPAEALADTGFEEQADAAPAAPRRPSPWPRYTVSTVSNVPGAHSEPANRARKVSNGASPAPPEPAPKRRPVSAAPPPRPPTRETSNTTVAWLVGGSTVGVLLLLALAGDPAPPPADTDNAFVEAPAPVDVAQPVTYDPSFSCAGATREAERLVCASQSLSARDRELAGLYGALIDRTPAAERRRLRNEQNAWIRRRNDCAGRAAPEACLAAAYDSRIAALRSPRPEARAAESPRVAEAAAESAARGRSARVAEPRPAAETPDTVLCVLHDGSEMRMRRAACRDAGGLVL
jgi:uncharacterized protein